MKRSFSIRNISVSRRMLYSFALMAVIPITVIAFISYYISNIAIENKTSTYSEQLLEVLGKTIQYEVAKYVNLTDDIIFHGKVNDMLQSNEAYSYKIMTNFQENISTIIRSRRPITPNVKQLFIINKKGTCLFSEGGFSITKDAIDKIINSYNADTSKNWRSMNINDENFIVYIQPVLSKKDSTNLGFIIQFLDANPIEVCLKNVSLGDGSKLFLLDNSGYYVASQKNTYPLGESTNQKLIKKLSLAEADKRIELRDYKFEDGSSMIVGICILPEKWWLIANIPNTYLRSEMSFILLPIILLLVLCLMCAIIVYRLLWGSIMRPIHRLVTVLNEVSKNNFNTNFIDDSRDELGFLGRAFSQIVQDMQTMILQVKNEQRLKREFELKMLQAQINPHFLFNTLNSLRFTALMSNATNVSDGLAALSNLLKNTIIEKNEFITVDEELKNIENYITIQRLRYGNIFTVKYEIEDSVRYLYTIKFLLQPIVENSIIHGLDESTSENEIKIIIKKEDEKLVTVISDNGVGFNTSTFQDTENKKRLSGIGIHNVQQRISLYFGDNYHFSVQSKEGIGTTTTIKLPALINSPYSELDKCNEGRK